MDKTYKFLYWDEIDYWKDRQRKDRRKTVEDNDPDATVIED